MCIGDKVKKNENFNMEPQMVAILQTSEYNYSKAATEEAQRFRNDGDYPVEVGQLAGMAFRAGEMTYPWPGITITKEARVIAENFGLDVSWATWNRGVYDNGMEGCPYIYVYFREKAYDVALQAFCDAFDISFDGLEETKGGLYQISAEAVDGRWSELYDMLHK